MVFPAKSSERPIKISYPSTMVVLDALACEAMARFTGTSLYGMLSAVCVATECAMPSGTNSVNEEVIAFRPLGTSSISEKVAIQYFDGSSLKET
nr:MAG: hypothetical protein [Bacteriophage sp.]